MKNRPIWPPWNTPKGVPVANIGRARKKVGETNALAYFDEEKQFDVTDTW